MLILWQLARSTNEGEKRWGKKEVEHLSSLRRRGRRSGWARGTRARWRRDAVSSRYRQLILRFEEPRPQIGRGLNWSRGSRNRIARATPATYSARPRFKEPDQPISTSFLARCRALPTWGNRSAPIRCICSVKSTRPRPCSRVPAPVAGNRIFWIRVSSTDFSGPSSRSSVTRKHPLFCSPRLGGGKYSLKLRSSVNKISIYRDFILEYKCIIMYSRKKLRQQMSMQIHIFAITDEQAAETMYLWNISMRMYVYANLYV